MGHFLNNVYAIIGTIIAIISGISCLISIVLKKKKKVRELWARRNLGMTPDNCDKETYKWITSKKYQKCMNLAYDEYSGKFVQCDQFGGVQ